MERIKIEKLPLSVFIIAKNEERCIGRVISAAQELSDDVVVIDSGSTDDTKEITIKSGARFVFHEWPGYGQQKRFGEEQSVYDWVLNLDADEVLSSDLISEIKSIWKLGIDETTAYEIKVTSVYPHQSSPRFLAEYNAVVRLYNKKIMRFRDHATLDAVEVPSGVKKYRLRSPCLHYSLANIAHYIDKMNRYTTIQVGALAPKPYGTIMAMAIIGFPFEFIRAYIGKRHITGGLYGFFLSMTRAYFRVIKYAKQYESRKLL